MRHGRLAAVLSTGALVAGGQCFSLTQARAEEAPPALVLNDPFAAPLWRIDVDASERTIVSGSPTKAASAFSLDDPAAPATQLRVPLRPEEMQRAHAVAISPDGKRVAYSVPPLADEAGYPKVGTARVYVLARDGGAIERVIDGIATRAQALRFTPDGAALVATLSDGCGVRAWRTADWTQAGADDAGYGGDGGSCCPAGDGRACDPLPDTPGLATARDAGGTMLVATSGDTGVRLYRLAETGLVLVAHAKSDAIALERAEGVAFSADARRLAVADARKRGSGAPVRLQVAILGADTLAPLRPPLVVSPEAVLSGALLDPKQTPTADQMALNRVAWVEANGREEIVAGGQVWCQIAEPARVAGALESERLDNCLVAFDLARDGATRFLRTGLERVMDIAWLPRRGALAVATQRRVALMAPDGTLPAGTAGAPFLADALAIDMRDRPINAAEGRWLGFDVSDDAQRVLVEDYRSEPGQPTRLVFDVAALKLDRVTDPPAGLSPPNRDPFVIAPTTEWWNLTRAPVIYGLPLDALKDVRDTYRAVALGPDQRAAIASTNFIRIADYASGNARIACQTRVAAEAYRIALSKDGTLAVAGHSDGTLRWYRVSGAPGENCTLEPLLAVHIRRTEQGRDEWTWTAWVPGSGRFASDGRARGLVGWQVEDATGQVSLVRFADLLKFYAPAVVKTALTSKLASREVVAAVAKDVREASDPLRLLVLSPDDGDEVDATRVRFDVLFGAAAGSTPRWPRPLLVTVDGTTRAAKRVAGVNRAAGEPVEIAAPGIVQVEVELPQSARRQARNVQVCFEVATQQACRTVNWAGALEPPAGRTLRAVLAGFSDYRDAALKLPFAQNDALDIARLFVADYQARVVDKTSRLKPDYDRVEIDLLVAPTTATARAEIDALKATGIVRVHEASVAALRRTLAAARAAAASGSGEDLTLFYFSGHGALNPGRRDRGLTALLDPAVADVASGGLERFGLASDELIDALESIPGEKVVILDACRTAAATSSVAFDPAAASLEFEQRLLTADVFFSAAPGQFSLDQGELAFDPQRPKGEAGNGLFTYAVLSALTDKGTATGEIARPVEVYDIDRYVRRFFNASDAESAAQRLVRLLRDRGRDVALQQPMYVPARRRPGASRAIRTVELKP